jgi:glutathione S-transferase
LDKVGLIMSNSSSEIILHNYPQSPVAEKVRVALGIKKLEWRDVEIPRLPPKPMLTALTGGYRRTPVMQIGADIYCDN